MELHFTSQFKSIGMVSRNKHRTCICVRLPPICKPLRQLRIKCQETCSVPSWKRFMIGMTIFMIWFRLKPGSWFNIKMSSYQYRKSHCGDKTVVRSSYLHHGISYAGKMTSLYWIRAQNQNFGGSTNVDLVQFALRRTCFQFIHWVAFGPIVFSRPAGVHVNVLENGNGPYYQLHPNSGQM